MNLLIEGGVVINWDNVTFVQNMNGAVDIYFTNSRNSNRIRIEQSFEEFVKFLNKALKKEKRK